MDGTIDRIAGLFAGRDTVIWIRSGLCVTIGILFFVLIFAGRPTNIPRDELGNALAADGFPERVAALRTIEKEKIDLAAYPLYRKLLQSPLLVERYYLARALGRSRNPLTYDDLMALIEDVQPNVVCQAYYALGQRGRQNAVTPIKTQMIQSDHWYTQWYGYRAMRRLGWRQIRSK